MVLRYCVYINFICYDRESAIKPLVPTSVCKSQFLLGKFAWLRLVITIVVPLEGELVIVVPETGERAGP